MTVTAVVETRQVQRTTGGSVHGALTIARTVCGLLITRAYQTLPGRKNDITCPNCHRLLYGRNP